MSPKCLQTGAKPALSAEERATKHGLSAVVRKRRKWALKTIDKRFRDGKLTTKFKADLISYAGVCVKMNALRKAAVDVLAAKFNRLLRAYRWQYQQPLPPVVNQRKRCVYPIVRELDMLEDSFFRCAQAFGFARVAKTLSLHEILANEDTPANENGAADGKEENKQAQS